MDLTRIEHLVSVSHPGRPMERGRLLIISSIRWGFLWQRHQALAVAAANDGWQVDFLQPRPRTIRQAATLPFRAWRSAVVTQDHGTPPTGVRILSPIKWLRPRALKPYDLALIYLPDRITEWFVRRNGARKVIYDAVVDWAAVPPSWFPPLGWRSSERRIAGWDHAAVTTDAAGMAGLLAERGCVAEVVSPAADEAFAELPYVPFERRRRAALYFGTVRSEVHLPALAALRASGVDVDIVGTVDDPATRSQLAKAQITVAGPLSVTALAVLAASYQVIVLPYRGERATTLMPAKFWNCVATGAWVVSLGLSTPDLPTVIATDSVEDFISAVHRCLDAPEEASVTKPSMPTWEARWRQMLAIFADVPARAPRHSQRKMTDQ